MLVDALAEQETVAVQAVVETISAGRWTRRAPEGNSSMLPRWRVRRLVDPAMH